MALDTLGQGWNISQKGVEIITENNTINEKATLLKNALNADLKEIGSPVLAKILTKNNVSQVVLQIQKIRNISAPKANENSHAAPRMLKLVLTDGDTYIQAIETAPIPAINREKTPPGSKLLIHSAKIASGYILLESGSCSLLGGQVPALFEKWELAKSVQHHNRQNASSDGPPAWVNFGCKIQSDMQDKPFKSLEAKNQEAKENTKFDLQRQDAIAEATSGAVKKVFGGGNKQPVQPTAYLKPRKPNDFPNKDRKNFKTKNISVKDLEEKPQKPSERVSLFDFLEDKLPPNESGNSVAPSEYTRPPTNNNYQRNVTTNQGNKNRNSYQSYNNPKPYNKFEADSYNLKPTFNKFNSESYNPKPTFNKFNSESYHNKPTYNKFEQEGYHNTKPHYNKFEAEPYSTRPVYNKFEQDQNSFRAKSEPKPQLPQASQDKIEGNVEVNGLSNSFGKMSLNSQFASRSLKQHLNLGPQKKSVEVTNEVVWKVGDDCVAKYWEDGKYYNANITAVTDRTCVVKFKGYGNIEEVLKVDCLPAGGNEAGRKAYHTGPMEFRRNTRTYRRQ